METARLGDRRVMADTLDGGKENFVSDMHFLSMLYCVGIGI